MRHKKIVHRWNLDTTLVPFLPYSFKAVYRPTKLVIEVKFNPFLTDLTVQKRRYKTCTAFDFVSAKYQNDVTVQFLNAS